MKKVELVYIPFPGYGHIVSMVESAKLLLSRDERLSITVLIIKLPFDTGVTAYINSLHGEANKRLRFMELTPDESTSEAVPQASSAFSFLASQRTAVRDAVAKIVSSSESTRLAGFVVDMLCTAMIDVANEFAVPTYVFFIVNTALLGLLFHVQNLSDHHGQDITELKDTDPDLSVPGFINPVPVKVLPWAFLDKQGGSTIFINAARRLRETKGIMINTFSELENQALLSLSHGDHGVIPPLYPVGPILNPQSKIPDQDDAVITWLDKQPTSSVVFLCFGSMGCFDEDQVKEIACGLERSGHRFLWSLRRPPSPEGTEVVPQEYSDFREVLPEGFLERTAGIGMVVGWAPQVTVLSHAAVGGFVSHCGWNSILESLWFGVPIATWPLYAEQQLNAFDMVKELGLAIEIRLDYKKDVLSAKNTKEVVTAEEIESGVRWLMEGASEVSKKAKEMKEKGRTAMKEGGSSYSALGRFIKEIMDQHNNE
ncbi:hypothetical protein LguiA_001323 [Lonicera macranthoides]